MEIIVPPTMESDVLAPTEPDASAESLREALVTKAECCVDHLCGCSNCC